MLILGVVLALFVGLSLGILGGGGSILTVPILRYALGVDAHPAIVTSLLVVGITSAVGTISHARAGNVNYATGFLFSIGGMSGAFVGGRLGLLIPGPILLVLFAAMMLLTAGAMLRKNSKPGSEESPEPEGPRPRNLPLLLAEGFLVGGFTGMVGAGGGFLVVPALVFLVRLPIHQAIGTSLMIISLKSFAGFLGYAGGVEVPWDIALSVAAAATVGSLIGARLSKKVPAARLRSAFGVFVLIMGIFVLVKELPGIL